MNAEEAAGGVWVGVDPGGEDNFGVAVLLSDGSTYTGSVSSADEAETFASEHAESAPQGLGVDTPLWWSSGVAGRRRVDKRLRETYGLSGGQVQSPSSLQGAVLAQGMMFVCRARERWPGVGVTETHPKALLRAMDLGTEDFWAQYCVEPGAGALSGPELEHERDALISAVAAREGFTGRWTTDLSTNRYDDEQDPKGHWLAPVHYYWFEGPEHKGTSR